MITLLGFLSTHIPENPVDRYTGFSFFRKNCFTILSSSEWNVIMQSLRHHPEDQSSHRESRKNIQFPIQLNSDCRNVRLAGWPPAACIFIGMDSRMICVSWPVVIMGLYCLAATMCFAIFFRKFIFTVIADNAIQFSFFINR